MLCFTAPHRYIFYNLKVCGNSVLSMFISDCFSNGIRSIHVLCLILVILITLQTVFIITIFFTVIWTVIFDTTIVIVLGVPCPRPCKVAELTDKCCVCSDCSTGQRVHCHSPSPWVSLLAETQFSFERGATVNKMLSNSICYREIVPERKSQSMWQTSLLL